MQFQSMRALKTEQGLVSRVLNISLRFSYVVVFRFVERCNDKGEAAPWGDTRYNNKEGLCKRTHKIMVFRQDEEQGLDPHTDDIGDLCIFLGDNESFCLSAKDYPGLSPNNSVYFGGHGSGFGICDLASRTISYLSDSPTTRSHVLDSPKLWIGAR